jgi:hypothetical protein
MSEQHKAGQPVADVVLPNTNSAINSEEAKGIDGRLVFASVLVLILDVFCLWAVGWGL